MLVRFPPNSMPKPDAAAAAVTATPRGAIIKHYLTSKKFLIALIAGTIAQTIMVLGT